MSKVSRMLRHMTIAVMAMGLLSCSSSSADEQVALSARETLQEYRAEAATLTLAPGWTWPVAPIEDRAADGETIIYEPGFGRQAADFYWYCSWASRAIDRRLTASARTEAVDRVVSIRDKYYYTTSLAPESRPAFDELLANAERGRMTGLRRDYAVNCLAPTASGAP